MERTPNPGENEPRGAEGLDDSERGAIPPEGVSAAGLSLPTPLGPLPYFSLQSELDTEYSDPFDAQPHPPPSDDGYMEPYDAQRAVSGEGGGGG